MRSKLFMLILVCVNLNSYAQYMIGGARVIDHPIYVNVYWDAAWNTTMAGVPLASSTGFDAFTKAVCEGSYFDGLEQYNVGNPSFGGSVVMPTTAPSTVNEADVEAFVTGLLNNPPPGFPATDKSKTIYVIFLPRTTALLVNTISMSISGIIGTTPSVVSGYHDCNANSSSPCQPFILVVTSLPISPACPPSGLLSSTGLARFARITNTLTHEMVEAATDPDGITGWRDRINPDGEIADFNVGSSCFLAGNTENYWSNAVGGGVSGYNDLSAPIITGVNRLTRGRDFQLEIMGSGFGQPPSDLPTLPATGKTQYLITIDSTSNIVAGHPVTATNLTFQSWRDDRIVIGGSDNPGMSSQNKISVQVFGRNNGQESNAFTLQGAVAKDIYIESLPSTLEADVAPYSARGRVTDQFGNGYLTSNIQWNLYNDLATTNVLGNTGSDLDGYFHIPVPLDHSGAYTLKVTIINETTKPAWNGILSIYPKILGINPDHYAIGTPRSPVTIHGIGLKEVTEFSFGNEQGLNIIRSGDGRTVTVIPPINGLSAGNTGWVDVVAKVVPQPGINLESKLTYYDLFCYYKAGVPVMMPALDGYECNPAILIAKLWDEAGHPIVDQVLASRIRFQTNRGSFSGTGVQREFTPASISEFGIVASLYEEERIPFVPYLPKVILTDQENYESGRQVNFNDEVCQILQQRKRIQKLADRMSIRDLLKEWISPPIPRDKFVNIKHPLKADITIAFVKSERKVQVRVTDANEKPVAGIPVAFVAVLGSVKKNKPLLTDKNGMASSTVSVSKAGTAKVLAVVDEYSYPLTAVIDAKKKVISIK